MTLPAADEDPYEPPWRCIARLPLPRQPRRRGDQAAEAHPATWLTRTGSWYSMGPSRGPRFSEAVRVRLPSRLRGRLDAAARAQERTHSEIIRKSLRRTLDPEPVSPDSFEVSIMRKGQK